MEIKIVKDEISLQEVSRMAKEQYGDMVKAVVDVEKEIMAIGGELHADANEAIIKSGSDQKDTWGISLYPEKDKDNQIVFNSFINVKPLSDNKSLSIESEQIKEKIRKIVSKLIK